MMLLKTNMATMAGLNQPFQPGAAVAPATKVELTISCQGLRDMDVFSKSDPLCVMYVNEFGQERFREFGRTETIMNCLDPKFVKKFIIDYFFEEQQRLRFDLYDKDTPGVQLERDDFLGSMECTLGEIVSAPNSRLVRKLKGDTPGANYGTIAIQVEELGNCKEIFHLSMRANKLDKKDFFGKSDPFLVFHRCNENGSWTIVHKTEVIKCTLDPQWRPFSIKLLSLCNGDYDRQILVECFDWNSNGGSDSGHELIGTFQTNVRILMKGSCPENVYQVINTQKQAKKKGYKNSGTVTVLSAKVEKDYSFLDYVHAGMQIHFTVAVDFTASNGNPMSPQSLHYINSHHPNQYVTALLSVGEIIQDYDSTKMFPALGFGARLPPDGRVSHEFFLNFNPTNPYCNGIGGVLQAYQQAISQVQLYGPTNFSPVINHVAKFAASNKSGSEFFILLIITDGVITDMDQTKRAIIAASRLPMAIIIVGVGDADFTAMEELDSDEKLLSFYNEVAERDIVQFVPMRDFLGRYSSPMQQKAHLAKEVLAEVPDQVVLYMKKIRAVPENLPARPPAGPVGERFDPRAQFATAPPVLDAASGVPMRHGHPTAAAGAPNQAPPPPYSSVGDYAQAPSYQGYAPQAYGQPQQGGMYQGGAYASPNAPPSMNPQYAGYQTSQGGYNMYQQR